MIFLFRFVLHFTLFVWLALPVFAQNSPSVKWKTINVTLPALVAYPLAHTFGDFYSTVQSNPICTVLPQKDNTFLVGWQSFEKVKSKKGENIINNGSVPYTYISKISADGRSVKNIHKFKARFAGFCQSSTGSAIGLVYGDTLIVFGYDKAWKQTFKQLIIGHEHPYTKEGAKFEPLIWGSVRLKASEKKYVIYFAHHQEWGKNDNRDVHQGDMLVQMNLDGSDCRTIWKWGVSHSLDQRLITHGKYSITAALGDAYPKGIALHRVIEKKNKFGDTSQTYFDGFPDYSPTRNCVQTMQANEAGITYGTLGSLHIKDNHFYITFSQRGKYGVYQPGLLILTAKTMRRPWRKLPLITVKNMNTNPLIIRSEWIGDYLFVIWKKEADYFSKKSIEDTRWVSKGLQLCEWGLFDRRGEIVRQAESIATDFLDGEDFFSYHNGDIGWAYFATNAKKEYRTLKIVKISKGK